MLEKSKTKPKNQVFNLGINKKQRIKKKDLPRVNRTITHNCSGALQSAVAVPERKSRFSGVRREIRGVCVRFYAVGG